MFSKNANEDVGAAIIAEWLMMTACAGVLNAIAFLGLGTFATHVTGFATLFGVHTAEHHFGNAMAALFVPLFFVLGATVSGLCVEARVRRNKVPHYDYVMYGCSMLLLIASAIGSFKASDLNPTYLHLERNVVLLSLICLASGLMNAVLSYSSRSTVRVTHLTGIATDLGRGLAELISLILHGVRPTRSDLRLSVLRSLTIAAFALGAVIGAFLFLGINFKALIVPAAYCAYAGRQGQKKQKGPRRRALSFLGLTRP